MQSLQISAQSSRLSLPFSILPIEFSSPGEAQEFYGKVTELLREQKMSHVRVFWRALVNTHSRWILYVVFTQIHKGEFQDIDRYRKECCGEYKCLNGHGQGINELDLVVEDRDAILSWAAQYY